MYLNGIISYQEKGDMMKKYILVLTLLLTFLLSSCTKSLNIISYKEFDSIHVNRNTSYTEITLPSSVIINLEDHTALAVDVVWDFTEDSFDITKDSLMITGAITLPKNITNKSNVIITQEIIIDPLNIEETMKEYSDFSIFHEILDELNLFHTLDLKQNITLFIPTNDAFNAFFLENNITKEEFLSTPQLHDFIDYYIVENIYSDSILRAGAPSSLLTSNIQLIQVSLTGSVITLNDKASIIESNIMIPNGIIHSIDTVIIPMIDNGVIDNDLKDLLMAKMMEVIIGSGLLTDILFGDGLTLFLPTTQAFEDMMTTYDLTEEELLDLDILDEILLSHIVTGEYDSEALYNNAPFTLSSYNDTDIVVTVVEGELLVNGITVKNIKIEDSYGIIVKINDVLLTDEMITHLENK